MHRAVLPTRPSADETGTKQNVWQGEKRICWHIFVCVCVCVYAWQMCVSMLERSQCLFLCFVFSQILMGRGWDSGEQELPASLWLIKKDGGGECFISNEPHNNPWWDAVLRAWCPTGTITRAFFITPNTSSKRGGATGPRLRRADSQRPPLLEDPSVPAAL